MALNFSSVTLQPKRLCFLIPSTHKLCYSSQSSTLRRAALSDEGNGGVTKGEELPTYSGPLSSARTQLDLLEQLTSTSSTVNGLCEAASCRVHEHAALARDLVLYISKEIYSKISSYESDGSSGRTTIRDQLAKLVGDRDDDFSIPLGKNLKKFSAKFLTTSQKRNIRRQTYMNEVSQRNDSTFFATIGAFVILPPVVILGIAIATGYVQLFP